MKNLINKMQELVDVLEAKEREIWAREDEESIEEGSEIGELVEHAGDLLYGFITGEYEDYEVDEAREMLKAYNLA